MMDHMNKLKRSLSKSTIQVSEPMKISSLRNSYKIQDSFEFPPKPTIQDPESTKISSLRNAYKVQDSFEFPYNTLEKNPSKSNLFSRHNDVNQSIIEKIPSRSNLFSRQEKEEIVDFGDGSDVKIIKQANTQGDCDIGLKIILVPKVLNMLSYSLT